MIVEGVLIFKIPALCRSATTSPSGSKLPLRSLKPDKERDGNMSDGSHAFLKRR
jgi:hypothetical protein